MTCKMQQVAGLQHDDFFFFLEIGVVKRQHNKACMAFSKNFMALLHIFRRFAYAEGEKLEGTLDYMHACTTAIFLRASSQRLYTSALH